jgi:hypothetical protein
MLRPYEAFLKKKENVRSQYIPFYLKWVSDCYTFLNEPLSNRLTSEQSKQFLSHMAKRHEDWQVKQADTALRPISLRMDTISGRFKSCLVTRISKRQ